MIENQSENIDNKEANISDQDHTPEDVLSDEDQINENDQSSSQKKTNLEGQFMVLIVYLK